MEQSIELWKSGLELTEDVINPLQNFVNSGKDFTIDSIGKILAATSDFFDLSGTNGNDVLLGNDHNNILNGQGVMISSLLAAGKTQFLEVLSN